MHVMDFHFTKWHHHHSFEWLESVKHEVVIGFFGHAHVLVATAPKEVCQKSLYDNDVSIVVSSRRFEDKLVIELGFDHA